MQSIQLCVNRLICLTYIFALPNVLMLAFVKRQAWNLCLSQYTLELQRHRVPRFFILGETVSKSHLSFHFPLPFYQHGFLNIWGLTACYCASSQEDQKKVTVEILTYNMYCVYVFIFVVLICLISFLTRLFVDDNVHSSEWKIR